MPSVCLDDLEMLQTPGESGRETNVVMPLWLLYKGELSCGMMGMAIQTCTTIIQYQEAFKNKFNYLSRQSVQNVNNCSRGGRWISLTCLQIAVGDVNHKKEDLEAVGLNAMRLYVLLGRDGSGIIAALDELGTALAGLSDIIRPFEDFHADPEHCGAMEETDLRMNLIISAIARCKDYIKNIKVGLEGRRNGSVESDLQTFLEEYAYRNTALAPEEKEFRQKALPDGRNENTDDGFLHELFEYLPVVEECLHQLYLAIEEAATRNQDARVNPAA